MTHAEEFAAAPACRQRHFQIYPERDISTMTYYSEGFNANSLDSRFSFSKVSNCEIKMSRYTSYSQYSEQYHFNFLTRIMIYTENQHRAVVPFSQLDPEFLACIHNKLIEEKGKPPALPGTPLARSPIKKGSL